MHVRLKGILLAGGHGSRLYPVTLAICKQLLPIFDKPMIYYPLSVLMMAGIREILIISTPDDTSRFEKLFGDGSSLGLQLVYAVQPYPGGLAQAFIMGASFIQNNPICLVLGDNIFYGHDFPKLLQEGTALETGGMIFAYHVKDPHRYGVVQFDEKMQAIDIEEKPIVPKSSYAIPGLYFYGPEVVEVAKDLKPSSRGEVEITDIHRNFLQRKQLKVQLMGRGLAWLDTGTFDAFQKASLFVQSIQERQGIKISCIEEIAYRKGYIGKDQLLLLAKRYSKSEYGDYLRNVAVSFGGHLDVHVLSNFNL
ncbi:MAG TPA: glucose-1-phosphate thymidylyltransferase RfbA [Chlamydiales bacterium]|nr:glucose-1-phosphate thymidylyltransferase RfbA [Chlamydiales bacterium]